MSIKKRGYIAKAKRADWQTPDDLYARLHEIFKFNFDPCPPNPTWDGLCISWGTRAYCNPPYNALWAWIEKAWQEAQEGKLVVMLIPARTDTKAWQEFIFKDATEIWFVKGRIVFKGAKAGAPFPSAVVIFDGKRGLGNPRVKGWEW
jgi:site-specific DNA-methyltransferase (adenine-specific)